MAELERDMDVFTACFGRACPLVCQHPTDLTHNFTPMRRSEIQLRPHRHNLGRIDGALAHVVMAIAYSKAQRRNLRFSSSVASAQIVFN